MIDPVREIVMSGDAMTSHQLPKVTYVKLSIRQYDKEVSEKQPE
jgi:hypothetical protein